MEITIRNPNREDCEKIAELSGQLGYPSSTLETARRLEQISRQSGHLVLVAADEKGQAVGWHIVHRIESDPFVEVGGMVVSEKLRSSGVGSRLLDELERWGSRGGLGRIRIRSNVVREKAHNLYTQTGYEKTKTAHIFEKQLLQTGRSDRQSS